MRPRLLLIFVVIALTGACSTTAEGRRYSKERALEQLKKIDATGLEVGVFPINGSGAVLDGDTIRVQGLGASLRLLAIDTEETFKKATERAAYAAGWEQYKKAMRGKSPRPVKMATPLGEDAKHFAQAFFDGVSQVKIERDHPGEIRDFYNRYLAYVLVEKNGVWANYNLECVRAGMSPYFVKYGRSRRFHKEFMEAERTAKEAQLGIWKPGAEHYDDYDERLKWWWERERTISMFEKAAQENPDTHIALTRWDAMLKLEQNVGTEVTVLGSVQEVRSSAERGPAVVRLARNRTTGFDVVFFDRDVLTSSGIAYKMNEYVQVRGVVKKYTDASGRQRLQMNVSLPGQVVAPSSELNQMLKESSPESAPAEEAE